MTLAEAALLDLLNRATGSFDDGWRLPSLTGHEMNAMLLLVPSDIPAHTFMPCRGTRLSHESAWHGPDTYCAPHVCHYRSCLYRPAAHPRVGP